MSSAKLLKFLGWIVIISGIIGGLIVINMFGVKITFGKIISYSGEPSGWSQETNPVGVAIGVGIIFEHIILGAFLIVIAHIGETVYEIKKKLVDGEKEQKE